MMNYIKKWTRENRNFNEDLKKSDLFKFLKSNLGELSLKWLMIASLIFFGD